MFIIHATADVFAIICWALSQYNTFARDIHTCLEQFKFRELAP